MKQTLAFLFAFLLAGPVGAQLGGTLDALNQEVDNLLAPFRDPTTQAELKFGEVRVDAERALSFQVTGLYKKAANGRHLGILVDNLEYQYAQGAPYANLNGTIDVDLVKMLDQKTVNDILSNVESYIVNLARSYTTRYGQAATTEAEVTDRIQDKQNNYVSLTGRIGIKIKTAKLPEHIQAEDILFTEVAAIVTLDVHAGIRADIKVGVNPLYKGFKSDQSGMKEALEKLLARDPQQLADIRDLFTRFDDAATFLVEGRRP